MTYEVSVTSRHGQPKVFACAGPNDQVALIYAGKVVEGRAEEFDQDAPVTITKDGERRSGRPRRFETCQRGPSDADKLA